MFDHVAGFDTLAETQFSDFPENSVNQNRRARTGKCILEN